MYIVSSVSIFFNLQIYSISQLKNRSRKTKSANKIIINRKEIEKAKEIKIKTRETKIETKTIEKSIETDARADTTTVAATATIITNRKRLLKLRKQFVCIYINFALKTVSILLSCLLLFNNL